MKAPITYINDTEFISKARYLKISRRSMLRLVSEKTLKAPIIYINIAEVINKERKINGKDKNVIYHHAFFYGSWCGDGVVDREFGEEFDDGTNSDKAGAYLVNNCKNPPSKNSN